MIAQLFNSSGCLLDTIDIRDFANAQRHVARNWLPTLLEGDRIVIVCVYETASADALID